MFNKIMDLVLDVFIIVLLFALAPILFALFSAGMPVYARVIGIGFVLLVVGAVVIAFRQKSAKLSRKEI
jgi:hypothetical protein